MKSISLSACSVSLADVPPAYVLSLAMFLSLLLSTASSDVRAQSQQPAHSILESTPQLYPPQARPYPAGQGVVNPGPDPGFVLPTFNDIRPDSTASPLLESPGQPSVESNRPPVTTDAQSRDQVDINQLLTQLVLEAIPHTYVDDDDWGGREERFDGWEVERDGLRIETRRKRRMVNHGTWKMYSAELINPDREFRVEVANLHQTENGDTGFDVHFYAHLDLHARQSKWIRGVQLYSISADGHAQVKLVISCEMGVAMDLTRFPPDMVFSPEVTSAEIIVDDFRIDRVSKLGGEFAQQVSRQVRRKLEEKIEEREDRLVDKINNELAENSDRLRLSIAEAIQSRWSEPARAFLPETVQQAMDEAEK